MTYSAGFLVVGVFYALSILLFCFRIIFDKALLSVSALRSVLAGFVLHLVFLATHLYGQGYPFLLGSFETFQIVSGCIVLAFLILSFFRRFLTTGIVLLPLASVFYILSLTRIVAYKYPGHFLENPWAFVHLVFVFMAIAVFMVSFGTGIAYLWQEYRIKHKVVSGLGRFPPLSAMDSIHYKALYIGFIFFTVGIITGGGWSKSTLGVYVSNNLKQMLSLAIWVFFAFFLNLRVARGWVGHKGILLSGIGFIAVLFLFLWVQN